MWSCEAQQLSRRHAEAPLAIRGPSPAPRISVPVPSRRTPMFLPSSPASHSRRRRVHATRRETANPQLPYGVTHPHPRPSGPRCRGSGTPPAVHPRSRDSASQHAGRATRSSAYVLTMDPLQDPTVMYGTVRHSTIGAVWGGPSRDEGSQAGRGQGKQGAAGARPSHCNIRRVLLTKSTSFATSRWRPRYSYQDSSVLRWCMLATASGEVKTAEPTAIWCCVERPQPTVMVVTRCTRRTMAKKRRGLRIETGNMHVIAK
jgi:hypothetical protein